MTSFAPSLVAASAAIILLLGSIHLLYTFRGRNLPPRNAALEARMKEVSPVLTRDTTMWKAWVSFNASHGLCAMLFGLAYGYLALFHSSFLLQSRFLLWLGLLLLLGYVLLGKFYWFSVFSVFGWRRLVNRSVCRCTCRHLGLNLRCSGPLSASAEHWQ